MTQMLPDRKRATAEVERLKSAPVGLHCDETEPFPQSAEMRELAVKLQASGALVSSTPAEESDGE